MATKDKITDKQAIERAADSRKQLDDQRLTELKNEKQLQEIKNEVINREAERLAAKHGKDHPRVQKLQARSIFNQPMLNSLDREIEKTSMQTEPLPLNAWRLHGKVLNKKETPVADIIVYFADENGSWIRVLGNSNSNETGYYSLTLSEQQIELAQKEKLYLSASNKDQQVIYSEAMTYIPAKGIINYQDIIINEKGRKTPPDNVK